MDRIAFLKHFMEKGSPRSVARKKWKQALRDPNHFTEWIGGTLHAAVDLHVDYIETDAREKLQSTACSPGQKSHMDLSIGSLGRAVAEEVSDDGTDSVGDEVGSVVHVTPQKNEHGPQSLDTQKSS